MNLITEEEFNKALTLLSTKQYEYLSEKYPASIENILFPRDKYVKECNLLLQYFYQVKGEEGDKLSTAWKLSEYVNFIRKHRDTLFPNNYRKKSRKFIARYPYKRSALLSQYEEELKTWKI